MKKMSLFILLSIGLLILSSCKQTASVCNAMSDSNKDHCYQKFAVSGKVVDLCDQIVAPAPRSKCYILLNRELMEPLICKRMANLVMDSMSYDPELCWQELAINLKDPDFCGGISPNYRRNSPSNIDVTFYVSNDDCIQLSS
ncbi:MAG: hypothetical protein U9R08_01300 [Nanoarchaeota archaeon]|nr:hypothetical protein [Nanoarchaeota archaeon]